MEIGAALGATGCQTIQEDHLINKGRIGKKSNGSATELYPTSPHFFRRARPSGRGLPERDLLRGVVDAGAARNVYGHPDQHQRPGHRPAARSYRVATNGVIPRVGSVNGICRAATFGRIAGFHAAQQQS